MNAMMASPVAKDERFTSRDVEVLADYRQRRALEEFERAELKRVDLAEQHSAMNSVDARIRAWEKVHGLRMPSDPKHRVLHAIAAATQLSLADVLNEQGLRSTRRASAGA
jgi:hypothetical protein